MKFGFLGKADTPKGKDMKSDRKMLLELFLGWGKRPQASYRAISISSLQILVWI